MKVLKILETIIAFSIVILWAFSFKVTIPTPYIIILLGLLLINIGIIKSIEKRKIIGYILIVVGILPVITSCINLLN